jgi:hypothetical protein
MRLRVRAPREFWLGAIYAVAGLVGFVIARDYTFGSGARMGPGYFPTVVSALLFLFGLAAMVRGVSVDGEEVGAIPYRPITLVIGSQVAFALLLDRLGFVVAGMVLLVLAAAASREFRLEAKPALGAAALVAACAIVFVKALGVPMPLVGSWLKPLLPAALGG